MRTVSATHTKIASPLGEMTAVAEGEVVVGLYFPGHWSMPDRSAFGPRNEDGFQGVRRELDEYFARERQVFDVSIEPSGSAFERRVWDLIRLVPYGATSTYGQLARELGSNATAREVGAAVGRNPLSIVIPCHRIVGASGKLTGYAGGLDRKRMLLELEGADVARPGTLF